MKRELATVIAVVLLGACDSANERDEVPVIHTSPKAVLSETKTVAVPVPPPPSDPFGAWIVEKDVAIAVMRQCHHGIRLPIGLLQS